jgi:hypothetical protein
MKKIIALLMVSTFSLYAGTGSIYSRFGIGEINPIIGTQALGMGNAGLSIADELNINTGNPAALGNILRTVISADYQFQNLNSSDFSGSSILNTGNINSFAVAFPVYAPKKMGLSFALLPYSTVGYEQKNNSGDTITQAFSGRGGLTSLQVGLSYQMISNLNIGLSVHYLFGAIYRDQVISFSDATFYGGSYHQTESMHGFGFTLGGLYSGIDKALGWSETSSLNLGASFFSGSSLNLNDQTLRTYSSNQDTIWSPNQTTTLPIGFSLGLSWLKNNIMYAADVDFQNWSNFKMRGVTSSTYQNSMNVGVGAEYLPKKDFIESFWDKVSYKLGGYVHQTYLDVAGTSINEMFGTAGIGFPLNYSSRLNVSVQYGIRGTTTSTLVSDKILRLNVSLTASELMFIQPPIE